MRQRRRNPVTRPGEAAGELSPRSREPVIPAPPERRAPAEVTAGRRQSLSSAGVVWLDMLKT